MSSSFASGKPTNLTKRFAMEPMDDGSESEDDDDYIVDEASEYVDQLMVSMEGPIMVQDDNKEQEWISCHGALRQETLYVYHADDYEDEAEDLNLYVTISIRGIRQINLGDDGILSIEVLSNIRSLPYFICGPSMMEWESKINECIYTFGEKSIVKSGWLLKKPSHGVSGADAGRLGGSFKRRYVRLLAKELRYYRSDRLDEQAIGNVSLIKVEEIIAEVEDRRDATPSDRGGPSSMHSTRFDIIDNLRAICFQAASDEEMNDWIQKLKTTRTSAKEEAEVLRRQRYLKETDVRIQLFDEGGLAALQERIDSDLRIVYPSRFEMAVVPEGSGNDVEAPSTIKEHLKCADKCMVYLAPFLDAIQKNDLQNARYDVLAPFLIRINDFLSRRLLPVISDPQSAEMLVATSSDIYNLITWLTKYQGLLKVIYCPVPLATEASSGSLHEGNGTGSGSPKRSGGNRGGASRTHCPLFDEIPDLCQRYVDGDDTYGSSSGTNSGTGSHLVHTILNLWEATLKSPQEALERHNQDGTFHTRGPVDVWRTLRQHISLAAHTKSPVLHVMVVDKVAIAMTHLIDSIISWIQIGMDDMLEVEERQDMEQEKDRERMRQQAIESGIEFPPGQAPFSEANRQPNENHLKDVQLEFLCALANDNALHIEEVYETCDGVVHEDIRNKVEDAFEAVTSRLVKCGNVCLKRLAYTVMSDVESQMEEIMTSVWLESETGDEDDKNSVNQMRVVLATLEDYLSDLREFLNPFWSKKVLEVLFEALTIRYCRSLLFRDPGEGKGACPQRSVDGVSIFDGEQYMLEQERLALGDDDDDDDDDDETDKSMGGRLRGISMQMNRMGNMLADAANQALAESSGSGSGSGGSTVRGNGKDTISKSAMSSKDDTNTDNRQRRRSSISMLVQGAADALGNNSGDIYKNLSPVEPTPEVLGRIAADINLMNVFFTKHAGPQLSHDYLGMLNEVLTLFALPAREIANHAMNMITEHPLAGISVTEVALAVMRTRLKTDLEKDEVEAALSKIEMILLGAEAAAAKNEEEGVDEGRAGLLFIELVEEAIARGALRDHDNLPSQQETRLRQSKRFSSRQHKALTSPKKGSTVSGAGGYSNSLAQRQKERANVDFESFRRNRTPSKYGDHGKKSDKGKDKKLSPGKVSPNTWSVDTSKAREDAMYGETEGLVDEVVATMAGMEEERQALAAAEEAEYKRAGDMLGGHFAGILNVKGFLQRKPPSATVYKRDWFMLQSRKNIPSEDEDESEPTFRPYLYYLSWASDRPPAQIQHRFEVDNISSMEILEIPHGERVVFIESESCLVLMEEISDPSMKMELEKYVGDANSPYSWDVMEEFIDDEDIVYPLRTHQYAKSQEFLTYSSSAVTSISEGRSPGTPGALSISTPLSSAASKVPGSGNWSRTPTSVDSGLSPPNGMSPNSSGSTPSSDRKTSQVPQKNFVFCLVMNDNARHIIRTTKLLKGLHWVNSLALAAGMAYEKETKEWNREARITLRVKMQQRAIAAATEERKRMKQLKTSVSSENLELGVDSTSPTTRGGVGRMRRRSVAAAEPIPAPAPAPAPAPKAESKGRTFDDHVSFPSQSHGGSSDDQIQPGGPVKSMEQRGDAQKELVTSPSRASAEDTPNTYQLRRLSHMPTEVQMKDKPYEESLQRSGNPFDGADDKLHDNEDSGSARARGPSVSTLETSWGRQAGHFSNLEPSQVNHRKEPSYQVRSTAIDPISSDGREPSPFKAFIIHLCSCFQSDEGDKKRPLAHRI